MKKSSINTGMSDHSLHKYWDCVRCPQLYSYQNNLGLKPPADKQGSALPFGTAVHYLLANHYAGRGEMDGAEDLDYDVRGHLLDAKKLVDEYKRHYRNEKVNVVSVETQIIVSVGEHLLSRRLDLTMEKDGQLFVVDHKTAYNPRRRISEAKTDPSLYSQEIVTEASGFAEKHGLTYGGFILNVIGKNERDGAGRFIRQRMKWSPEWKAHFGATMQWILSLPDQFKDLDPWRWPRTGECVGRYGPCPFRDLCLYGKEVIDRFQ